MWRSTYIFFNLVKKQLVLIKSFPKKAKKEEEEIFRKFLCDFFYVTNEEEQIDTGLVANIPTFF